MRSPIATRLVRARRDLRFVLADRYRRLLGSRFALLASVAAATVDLAVRVLRRDRRTSGPETTGSPAVVRALVVGEDTLTLTVTGAPAGADAIVLRATGTPGAPDLVAETVVDAGDELVRLAATLPDDAVADGVPRLVLLRAGDRLVPLPAPTDRPAGADAWPPALGAGDGGLTLVGRRPVHPAVTDHAVRLGVRTLEVGWAAGAASRLVLTADDDSGHSERAADAQLHDGRAVAVLDLTELVPEAQTKTVTLAASVETDGVRVPLALPAAPKPTAPEPPRYVRLPTTGRVTRTVEVDYRPDGRLVVRIGDVSTS